MAYDASLWNQMVNVLDNLASQIPQLGLNEQQVRMFYQIKCHTMLNGNKLGLEKAIGSEVAMDETSTSHEYYLPNKE